MADIPDGLIELERAAEEARARLAGLTGDQYDAQERRWCEAAGALRAAVTEYAEATGSSRQDVERAVRRALHCAQEDPAVE
ncbi:hypothetical protein JK359_10590 [Streptomyces actinomycinicus]|uniref:Uncharacterized protein n=1 Tax=Streptomyces actinomycinicus TaxID=1695166 RepID=A0A937EHL5_9ACTN|nr:hypothetical protein [Streptomyces actinomycinicus]MBL1082425.1 hypothetical protein [Streptomyces actinomycinicus]